MAIEEQSLLACGRPIDQVWEHIEDPPDEHEATCPECQQARRNLVELDRATSELRSADEADPEFAPPPSIKSSIMELARAEVRRGSRLPLRPPARDDLPPELTISEQAVAGVVRHAADQLSGVHARRCRVRARHPESTAGDVTDSATAVSLVVELGVALSSSVPILATIDRLRAGVEAAVRAEIGMGVEKINVSVEDLFDA